MGRRGIALGSSAAVDTGFCLQSVRTRTQRQQEQHKPSFPSDEGNMVHCDPVPAARPVSADQVPPKIIYIMSLGHSGSTILELLINRKFADVTSLGEIHQTFLRRNEHQKTCTCGAEKDDCPVWGRINFRSLSDFDEFYESILSSISSGYVTDSSKSLDIFRRHHMHRERNCCVIFLRKDLVSYYQSARRRSGREYNNTLKLLRYNPARIVFRWLFHNFRMYSFLRRNRIAHMTVTYEDVCNDTAAVARELSNMSGMRVTNGEAFESAHLLRGNKARFDFIRDPEVRPYVKPDSSPGWLSYIDHIFNRHLVLHGNTDRY